MSDTKTNDDELVVLAGSVTVKQQVGAGMAFVDVQQGDPIGDVDDETRDRLLQQGAIGRRDGQPFQASTAAGRPVPGEVEPNEIDPDVIPGGSVEQVLGWVGDDLARARVALHEEGTKQHARIGLTRQLEEKIVGLESEPASPAEHLDSAVAPVPEPAAVGGVALASDEPAGDADTSADGADAAPTKRSRRS